MTGLYRSVICTLFASFAHPVQFSCYIAYPPLTIKLQPGKAFLFNYSEHLFLLLHLPKYLFDVSDMEYYRQVKDKENQKNFQIILYTDW